ncbi:hypothetical protein HRE53_16940 [Acaryochloris sp. 'Moss Beach']|uniref:hypothetical protein n=1 Tax=Acaryochloris sp. 'Moss Beach' TaxID=2740837 RepID=UPI001F43BE1A|nr:hypothetical protein [Acaryochloris sp. 'Moss Beach']UJB68251.1 hypothetical protein HRE53_16940 [Acaryochloris sp. 'Moss Beach']
MKIYVWATVLSMLTALPAYGNDIYSGIYDPFDSIYSGSNLQPLLGQPSVTFRQTQSTNITPHFWEIDQTRKGATQTVVRESSFDIQESGTLEILDNGIVADNYLLERRFSESGAMIDRTYETHEQGTKIQITTTTRRQREIQTGF